MQMDGAQAYKDEATELLAELEEALLELENNPSNLECVARVFRTMHTIKGSGAMFGFEEIARFTHDVETTYDRVRSGELAVSKELLTLTLLAKDHIHVLLAATNPTEQHPNSDKLLAQFRQHFGETSNKPDLAAAQAHPAVQLIPDAAEAEGEPQGDPETFWVRYTPAPDTQLFGTRPLALLGELAELGAMRELFSYSDLPSLEEMDPEKVYCRWDVLLNTTKGENGIRDVFIFVEDEGGLTVEKLAEGRVRGSDLEELLKVFQEQGVDSQAVVMQLKDRMSRKMQQIARSKLQAQTTKAEPAAAPAVPQAAASIRVESSKLDTLVNMVGELVILQSRLTQVAYRINDPVLGQIGEDLERLVDEMRDNALSIRMLPFGTTFGGFKRLMRDLAASLGKEVDFVTEGADTELDKTVIDRLKDPLMHILRNSIDHGLESAVERLAAGKSEKGTVRLGARHASSDVIITVQDDGRGINHEKVRAKAVERGIIAPDAELSEKEINALIFEPGFSTADHVSSVSGRGVGMDVVKRSIDALRGSVEVESTPGKGAAMHIRLPLTLAIIDGMLVRIGQESFILPLATVEACQERFIGDAAKIKELEVIERMGRMIPCVSLRKLLSVPGDQPNYERIIIAGVDGEEVGLAVDKVVGRQQAVIKSLDNAYRDIDWISGTTINGDGGISLILDVPQLVRFAHRRASTELS